ncbi:MAG: FAD-dependent oxidoreductase [Saprospiraceae bacterium]
MKKILVVGQGIAGTTMAWALRQRGAQVHLIDADAPTSSSSVAAGIINPVTGKRYVKSWGVETFWPAARQFYGELEQYLGVRFWHETPILRLLTTHLESNDWAARCALADYADWLGERPDAGAWSPYLHPRFQFGLIQKSARVDFSALLPAFRQKWQQEGRFSIGRFEYSRTGEWLRNYDQIVYCEGWRAMHNPYFPGLAWQVVKGEAFIIRFPEASATADMPSDMVKKEALIAPLGNGLYWAGGTYNWTFDDELPTAGERAILRGRLADMLAAPYEIVAHRAAVRPSTKDRRPFLGLSLLDPRVALFNGLGTKGALLAPYWAQHLADHLLNGAALDPEVDIRRFSA